METTNTYEILRLLLRYWALPSHPIFRAEDRRHALIPASQLISEFGRRTWKPIGALALVVLGLAAADFLCGGSRHPLASALFSACSLGGGSFILFCVLLLTYLWPVTVAVAASGVIAQERERQTWDVLLTTPLAWHEIVLVKLAAALRRFNPYSEIFLWVQAFLLAIIFVLVMGQMTRSANDTLTGLLQLPLVVLTMAEFAIARAQDYVLAGLIGLVTSLLASTRQSAAGIALMASLAWVLVRALITTAIVFYLNQREPSSFPALLILLSTGPSSVVTIAFPGLIAAIILVSMILLREVIIRVTFRWLVRHLGETGVVAVST